MILVELTEREARAITNALGLIRGALREQAPDLDPPSDNLATGHGKLIAALERQETTAP